MNDPRESDLLKTHIDLIDLSAIERDSLSMSEKNETASTTASKGLCVREFEEEMDNLKKENFNLKLRLYFLEEKNGALPEGVEEIQKQFIDLKIENENLSRDINDHQELLREASKALHLLEEEKNINHANAEEAIIELKHKLGLMEQEKCSLQQAFNDINKSHLGNETGFADFVGAVDHAKEIEFQRRLLEMSQQSDNFQQQITEMTEQMRKLKTAKEEAEIKYAHIKYEKDELKDKLTTAEAEVNEKISNLESELKEYKDKWAATQCDLHDSERKCNETEEERVKTLKMLQKTMKTLDEERQKIHALEATVGEKKGSASIDASQAKKDMEIEALKEKLAETQNKLQLITKSDLNEKNKEIEKLKTLMNKMEIEGHSLPPQTRFSFDHLYESFNDLKFQQAMEIKKQSQQNIEKLMDEIITVVNSKAQIQMKQLQQEMAIVVEKQEVADTAFSRCAELCSFTLEHLHELAKFLSAIIQQKEIRDSLNNRSLIDIQNIIDKSMEISRHSIDGRFSSLANISNFEMLLPRNSIANVREIQNAIVKVDNSAQTPAIVCEICTELRGKYLTLSDEHIELKRINQVLEDEICDLKEKVENRDEEIVKRKKEINSLKEAEDEVNILLEDYQRTIETLQIDKLDFETKFQQSVSAAKKLESRLNEINEDLDVNWITKEKHNESMKKLKDEIVSGEAQVAAIRMELDEIRNIMQRPRSSTSSYDEEHVCDDIKENQQLVQQAREKDDHKENNDEEGAKSYTRRTIEISDDRKRLLMSTTEMSASCNLCLKYQARNRELKECLNRAVEKLKKQAEQKALVDQQIKKQLYKTENVMQQARFNMENILKNQKSSKD